MAILTALRQLCGDFGLVSPGETFYVSDDAVAESLEARGLAQRFHPKSSKPEHPASLPESLEGKAMKAPHNKMKKPSENK